MERFAKIFEVNGTHQLLVTKEYDHDDEVYQIKSEIQHKGVGIGLSIGFKGDDKERDKFFDKYNQEVANNFFDELSNYTH